MLNPLVIVTLTRLGVRMIEKFTTEIDIPQTEQEFLSIKYQPSELNITWNDFQVKFQEEVIRTQKKLLRRYRDILLSQSDWVMTADVFASLSNKSDWIAYRQALRDLPATITEYIWKGNSYEDLDFSQMNIPQTPPVLRT